jgi:hypothetical protein
MDKKEIFWTILAVIMVVILLYSTYSFILRCSSDSRQNPNIVGPRIYELANPPTEENQMTITPSELYLKYGQKSKVLIAFLNIDPSPNGANCAVSTCSCQVNPTQTCTLKQPIYNEGEFNMKKDQINTWTVALESPDYVESDCLSLCECRIHCTGGVSNTTISKDFIVTWVP